MKFLSRDYKKYKNDYLFHKSAGMLKLEFYFKQYNTNTHTHTHTHTHTERERERERHKCILFRRFYRFSKKYMGIRCIDTKSIIKIP